jgi:ribose transport system permease protein
LACALRWKASAYVISGFSPYRWRGHRCAIEPAQPAVALAMSSMPSRRSHGGTSLSGGEGSILGTVIGAFLIAVPPMARLLDVPQEWRSSSPGHRGAGRVPDILRRRQG